MENTPSNTEASSGTSALDDGFGAVPVRAVRLTLMLEADSLRECCAALEQIAWAAERGELTTGSSGGYGSGYTYELLQNPEQTHERYFAELRRHLAEKTPNGEVRGASRLAGEASSREAATSTVVLEGDNGGTK